MTCRSRAGQAEGAGAHPEGRRQVLPVDLPGRLAGGDHPVDETVERCGEWTKEVQEEAPVDPLEVAEQGGLADDVAPHHFASGVAVGTSADTVDELGDPGVADVLVAAPWQDGGMAALRRASSS